MLNLGCTNHVGAVDCGTTAKDLAPTQRRKRGARTQEEIKTRLGQ